MVQCVFGFGTLTVQERMDSTLATTSMSMNGHHGRRSLVLSWLRMRLRCVVVWLLACLLRAAKAS